MGEVVHVTDGPEFDKEKMTAEEIQARTFQLLEQWVDAKKIADDASETEMDLRKQVVAWAGSDDVVKGTEWIPLNGGYKLKLVKGLNYNVDQMTVKLQLDAIAETGPEGALIAQRLMKWKASLSLTEYEQLPQDLKTIANRCITTSDKSPTIEIVAPSTKGKAKAKDGMGV